ncbi:malonyl-CoA decarboxylase, mitochondrial-like [Pocillopora damicornis]|uniref:malonyl-CoA decarboxylase, mitochondrial-like n=1 Tax=Pocillopora damicornis TaxID=46731 RepID=UPI000F5559CC|nr:malonyl-CoA decarboxylase, mitochondrial-like [Pocillopora damicornis]
MKILQRVLVLRFIPGFKNWNQNKLSKHCVLHWRTRSYCTSSSNVVHNVESKWLRLLFKMADSSPPHVEDFPSQMRMTQIREIMSKAARMRRTDSGGDLMPNAVAKEIKHFYSGLSTKAEKLEFFLVLERDLGVDHKDVVQVANSLANSQENGLPAILKAEEKLRQALEPAHTQLLSQISKLPGGVKDIVDMRGDLLEGLNEEKDRLARQELQALSSSIKNLLAQWFAVGLLDLRQVTWESPGSILEKVLRYEAVHSMSGWEDLKRRLAPDRRCYIYTHRSMPGEPVVVLHTALEYEIADNIQVILSEPEVDRDACEYELEKRTAAVFYSITSTQKGLSGVDLGNFLIKHVVEELRHEFPNITQYSTLSPIPGFKQWLKLQLSHALEQQANDVPQTLLLEDEQEIIQGSHSNSELSPLSLFKNLLETSDWHLNPSIADCLRKPLVRLCTKYLYKEKRRGFVMDPVGNFHIRNGAWMWRLNWLADVSARGMDNSFGLMMNYKYVLEDVDKNNQQYLLNGTVAASPQFLEPLRA